MCFLLLYKLLIINYVIIIHLIHLITIIYKYTEIINSLIFNKIEDKNYRICQIQFIIMSNILNFLYFFDYS